MVWALKKAPVSDPVEALILVGLADHAHEDGTVAYAAQNTLATYARTSSRTVRRKLAVLEAAGLIKRGDQQMVAHIPTNRRPIVWDLCLDVEATPDEHIGQEILEPILGGQDVRPDTSVRPELGGRADTGDRSPVSGRTSETSRPDTGDIQAGHGCPTNRPLTIHEPSISSAAPSKAPKAAAAHAVPAEFGLSPEREAWAKEHAPAINAKRETDAFVDYWHGEGGKKKNWETTWRNWMRRAQTDAERRGWKPSNQSIVHPMHSWIPENRR
jgi:hypothetical protein